MRRHAQHVVRKAIHRVASENPAVSKNFIVSVLYITETEASIQNSLFDCHDDMVINCHAAELHLIDGRWALKTARRESYMTVQLPVKYDASADAPRFRQFLQEIFADDADAKQKEQALLEMIGYHMPQTRDFSDAVYRRAIVLTFNHKFEGAACDPQLSDKLIAELPGIFNMALDAIAGVITRKAFTDPPSSIEAKQHWRIESDQVAQFLEECCELYKDHHSASHDIYARY